MKETGRLVKEITLAQMVAGSTVPMLAIIAKNIMLSNVMSVPSPKILVGDCKEQMAKMPDNSVDSIVTDPPYGLEFMGKEWDKLGAAVIDDSASVGGWQDAGGGNAYSRNRIRYGKSASSAQGWHEDWAREALRILKPGGHLLSFGGSRTYHRMACAIEDAGFEIRDQIMWVYGSGFPKSLDVSKAIDKAAGAKREVVGTYEAHDIRKAGLMDRKGSMAVEVTAPATPEAKQWEGWGTALKPAHEPIVVARKPLDGTVANNVLAHGTGALNIDGCRVTNNGEQFGKLPNRGGGKQFTKAGLSFAKQDHDHNDGANAEAVAKLKALGRFPANFIHDGSDEVLELFPNAKGAVRKPTGKGILDPDSGWNNNSMVDETVRGFADSGSAARFFYCAKANKKERNAGLTSEPKQNHHPTVKPVALMRYLVRLVTPPNGIVFDPFLGSGTTAVAAILEGFEWSGCEITPEYLPIIEGRVAWATEEAAQPEMELF